MILFMGVIGAGKSLQGRMLADDNGFNWVSTGELFRKNLSDEETKKMKTGKLYSDQEVIKVIDRVLDDLGTKDELIFDGFPRTVTQAKWLMKQIEEERLKLTAVFNLKANDEEISRRLHARGRFDDTDEGIKARMDEYHNKTQPMINYFKESGVSIINIDSNQTPEKVHEEIKSHLR